MGYTLYWRRPEQLPAEAFEKAAEDVRTIVAAADVPLAGLKGTGETVIDGEQICFNGWRGQACEPFLIARYQMDHRGHGVVSSCCRTQRLPYDRCVKAALIVLNPCRLAIRRKRIGQSPDTRRIARSFSGRTARGRGFSEALIPSQMVASISPCVLMETSPVGQRADGRPAILALKNATLRPPDPLNTRPGRCLLGNLRDIIIGLERRPIGCPSSTDL